MLYHFRFEKLHFYFRKEKTMEKQIRTNGDLMDMVSMQNNNTRKALVRDEFQGWCKENGKTPFNANTVMEWRNITVSPTLLGKVVTA